MGEKTGAGPYALRLYTDGNGGSSLLCREPGHECPQWWYKPENRYLFATPQEALAFIGVGVQGTRRTRV
jgi:hypothetical protein